MEHSKRVQAASALPTSVSPQKALEISRASFLGAVESLENEIRDFIGRKIRRNEYFRDSAATKHNVPEHFASFVDQWDPILVSTVDIERFYRAQQARVSESIAQSCMTTLRSFFSR